jgi:hypothetical protein
MNILIILLGCNIRLILLNRLETSFRFIEQTLNNHVCITSNRLTDFFVFNSNSNYHITWFLSGGIKNNFKDSKSEASILKYQIDNNISLKYENVNNEKINWDFVLDEKSTNTAENFIWASHFINTTEKIFDDIYVVTFDFHFPRASEMLKMIDPSKNFKWILRNLEENDSRYWESIHIRNVKYDVAKARVKFQDFM